MRRCVCVDFRGCMGAWVRCVCGCVGAWVRCGCGGAWVCLLVFVSGCMGVLDTLVSLFVCLFERRLPLHDILTGRFRVAHNEIRTENENQSKVFVDFGW